jgi:hypothetical protein
MGEWHPRPLLSFLTLDLLSSFCCACFETKHESDDTSLLISLQEKLYRHELETGSLRRNIRAMGYTHD